MDTIKAMQKVETAVHTWKHWQDEEWPAWKQSNSDEHASQMVMLKRIHDAVMLMASVMAMGVGIFLAG